MMSATCANAYGATGGPVRSGAHQPAASFDAALCAHVVTQNASDRQASPDYWTSRIAVAGEARHRPLLGVRGLRDARAHVVASRRERRAYSNVKGNEHVLSGFGGPWRPAGDVCAVAAEVRCGRPGPACGAARFRRRSSNARPIAPASPSRPARVARHRVSRRDPATGNALRACQGPHRPGTGERMVGVSPTPERWTGPRLALARPAGPAGRVGDVRTHRREGVSR